MKRVRKVHLAQGGLANPDKPACGAARAADTVTYKHARVTCAECKKVIADDDQLLMDVVPFK